MQGARRRVLAAVISRLHACSESAVDDPAPARPRPWTESDALEAPFMIGLRAAGKDSLFRYRFAGRCCAILAVMFVWPQARVV